MNLTQSLLHMFTLGLQKEWRHCRPHQHRVRSVSLEKKDPHHILMGQSHRLSALIDTDQSISRGEEQTLPLCQSYNWQRNLAFISRGQIKLFYLLSPQIGSSPSKSSGTRLSNLHKILFQGLCLNIANFLSQLSLMTWQNYFQFCPLKMVISPLCFMFY